jgi:4-diphosphocytidyl-2-C-methyl-D-erythritol kinase
MRLEKKSPCKVNLLLNILGKRADGFHELETVMQPVNFFDELVFARGGNGIQLSCSDKNLPTDSKNLVFRAAENFLASAKISDGEKNPARRRAGRRQRQRRDDAARAQRTFWLAARGGKTF